MKAIDVALLDARGRVLEGHLRRVEAALPAAPETFRHGIAVFDVVTFNLLLSIQIVLDLGIHACIHHGLQAPSSYDDAFARLEHAGVIADPIADHLEKAAAFRDACIHAFDQVDPLAIHRAARVLPTDLRGFMAALRAAL